MNAFEQGLLRYLAPSQLRAIQAVRVGIGGAGGLGSNCAMVLVRSGFRHLEILDQDVIEASNLNRQQYYVDEIGQPKVAVLRTRLLDINPDLDIQVRHVSWSPACGPHFEGCDFVIEAFDRADTKSLFVECHQDRARWVVSGNGMAGLLHKAPLRRRRLGNIVFVGDAATDSAAGHPPMAPRVTQCAAMMAEVVLDIVLGLPAEGEAT